ncbi:hypothetical protein R1flu_016179 [Riccia fluitans]|uniref:Uncharacterized protein n=1 Tax=Riccia fluitans TaxID=41844 RepID=A0ABD1YLL3_9MARC
MESSLTSENGVEFEKDKNKRRPLFTGGPYPPPSWASHLRSVPLSFVSLGLFPTPIHRLNLPGFRGTYCSCPRPITLAWTFISFYALADRCR